MSDRVSCIVTSNPLNSMAIGATIAFKIIDGLSSNATKKPDFVINWEYFQGALMSLALKSGSETQMIGTAFMVAPGVAITATHNLYNCIDEMSRGEIVPYCIGIRDTTADLWRVSSVTYGEDDDISLLSLEANSGLPLDNTYYQFGITTRAPMNGEEIHIVGFRAEGTVNEGSLKGLYCNIITAIGSVIAVYPHGRDKMLIPYPAIEIDCGSLGGMSGGVAIDRNGLVVGIISRGFDTEDQSGPTYVSWIIKALIKHFPISWPPGLSMAPMSLLNMDSRLVFIDRREALEGSTENELNYTIWFE